MFNLFSRCASVNAAGNYTRRNQRCRLRAVNIFERFRIRFPMLGLEVDDLASDHSVYCASAARYFLDDLDSSLRRTTQFGKHFVCLGLQRIAGENCDRLSENFMTGRPATAQIVVVECRQIVVDQRIGVQHFQRRAQVFDSHGKGTGDHAARFHAKNGAQPLSPGKYAVAHGFMNGRWILARGRQELLQRPIG